MADENAWWERRQANHLQARAELRVPTIESGLLNVRYDPGNASIYEDRLERAFERRFKLLMNYRMLYPPSTVDVETQRQADGVERRFKGASRRPQIAPTEPSGNGLG